MVADKKKAAEEKSAEPVIPDPPFEPTVVPVEQSVSAEVWALHKWGPKHQDQARGFLHFTKRTAPGSRSNKEWDALHAEFQKAPAGRI